MAKHSELKVSGAKPLRTGLLNVWHNRRNDWRQRFEDAWILGMGIASMPATAKDQRDA
jgi:hypothetical protein